MMISPLSPPCRSIPVVTPTAASAGRRRLYSAVPGRVFVATRAHSAGGEREVSFNKGDRVKGGCPGSVCVCECVCVCTSVCVFQCVCVCMCVCVCV